MHSFSFSILVMTPLLWAQSALAQLPTPVEWPLLADPVAQQFDDPYRELTQSQFESLMALARLKMSLEGDLPREERENLNQRSSELSRDLRAQGLDPDWILAQREAVAERRQRAAIATNSMLDGKSIELSGYLLVAPDIENGETVAYLLPDRGVCMHLPPPAPNQLVRLEISRVPDPLGACIASAVRGRLIAYESTRMVPVIDDTVPLWSQWRLEVTEIITSGIFTDDTVEPLGQENK